MRPSPGGDTMNPIDLTRRTFLRDGAMGLGSLALASLLAEADDARLNPLTPRKPPSPAKATAVIVLHLAGAPPHLDLLDYKPELVRRTGEPIPESFIKG